ncbi:uncharacterized protein LOC126907804 [Daktulosphaira vitifoliae]|uniref:uncharacterized protein LOC126907804 n=1 Tax=Daktulosphaira vitifoliae TaxID=58002 RepID=UPI0021AAF792|nr:uncharacterized protein LOC126907804 [Daktulosphaira vitifoliae]
MFLLKLYIFNFVMFSVMMCTNSKTNLEKVDQLDTMLMYSGWKNLNELISVTYYNRIYHLQNLINTPTHIHKVGQKIRALTIFIGCTYAKVMNDVLLIISKILKECQQIFRENIDITKGCICTEELINIISLFITPLATLLKGAMDTLDLLHALPLAYQKHNYLVSPELGRMGDILFNLNIQTLSRNDISSYTRTLYNIEVFYDITLKSLYHDTEIFCEFVNFNTNSVWKEWEEEYKAIIYHNVKLEFLRFFKRKIKNYIKKIIIEKYFQLGFKFDPTTEETFLSTPNKSIDLELEFKDIDEKPPTLIQIENHQLF